MKKPFFVCLAMLFLGIGLAQTGQGISGTVTAAQNSNLQGAVVIACLLENDECSEKGSVVVQLSAGSSAKYTLPNLKAKTGYVVLAWKDLNNNSEADSGDEIAVYLKNGKAVLVTPPATGIDLRLAKFNGDVNALLGSANPPTPTTTTPVAPPAATNSPAIRFDSSGWTDNQDGSYSLEFDARPNNPTGYLQMVVLASRAKQGGLIAQGMSIWKEYTQGKFDAAGKDNARFVRRLPSGLNTAVLFGSLVSVPLENGTTFENQRFFITTMLLVETNNLVTPLFMVASRVGSSGYSGIQEAMPYMEKVVQSIQPIGAVKAPVLYSTADLARKWTNRSGTYASGNLVNPSSGTVVGAGYTQTAFQMKLEMKPDGTGNYFASLLTNNTGNVNTNTENTPMRWRIVGDRLFLERPRTGRTSQYVLYGMGKDANGQAILLVKSLLGNFKGEILSFPDETWFVEK